MTDKRSGMELMAANLLRALGIDPEKLTKEFQERITQFEQGLAALNKSLAEINERDARMEKEIIAIRAMQREILNRLEGKPASVGEQGSINGAAEGSQHPNE